MSPRAHSLRAAIELVNCEVVRAIVGLLCASLCLVDIYRKLSILAAIRQ